MHSSRRPSRGFLSLAAAAAALVLAGCVGGRGAAPAPKAAEPIDVRKFIGPDYCPELRVRPGTEVLRRTEPARGGEAGAVVWQASIGETARECLYDLAGNLTIRVGISGRVVAGPKGGPATVMLPLRIAVAKFQEAPLFSELYPVSATIPAELSGVFREVYEVTVPAPGTSRNYIVYVGFDEEGKPERKRPAH